MFKQQPHTLQLPGRVMCYFPMAGVPLGSHRVESPSLSSSDESHCQVLTGFSLSPLHRPCLPTFIYMSPALESCICFSFGIILFRLSWVAVVKQAAFLSSSLQMLLFFRTENWTQLPELSTFRLLSGLFPRAVPHASPTLLGSFLSRKAPESLVLLSCAHFPLS